MYFIGGGPRVPVDSEYLGCMRDEKHSVYARALFEGMLRCNGTMTTQVTYTLDCLSMSPVILKGDTLGMFIL